MNVGIAELSWGLFAPENVGFVVDNGDSVVGTG